MTDNELETRASLESALMLLRRLGQLEHAEDCDHYNACQNAECECPEDDDGCVTHETASCSCLVFDAGLMARNVATVLARTMPKAGQMPSAAIAPGDEVISTRDHECEWQRGRLGVVKSIKHEAAFVLLDGVGVWFKLDHLRAIRTAGPSSSAADLIGAVPHQAAITDDGTPNARVDADVAELRRQHEGKPCELCGAVVRYVALKQKM